MLHLITISTVYLMFYNGQYISSFFPPKSYHLAKHICKAHIKEKEGQLLPAERMISEGNGVSLAGDEQENVLK